MVKIFCIGLHKTGTSTLCDLATSARFNAIHSTKWQRNIPIINKYNFFCDGGSHYNGLNEFDYVTLMNLYPDSKFIINIRHIRSWIVSKCKHAGWNKETNIINEDIVPYHDKIVWRKKSLKNISLFIQHYCDWYIKVISYFMDKKDRAIIVDIENDYNIDKLKKMLNAPQINISHKNKSDPKIKLSDLTMKHIDYEINEVNRDKLYLLELLINQFDEN